MKTSGYTLIEFLVALTILAMFVGIIGATLKVATDGWSAIESDAERIHDVHLVGQITRRLIEQALPTIEGGDEHRDVVFIGGSESLIITTRAPAHHETPGIYLVEFSVQKVGEMAALVVNYEIFRGATDSIRHRQNSRILLDAIETLSFSYFGRLNTQSETRWVNVWRDSRLLPSLVRVTMRFDSRDYAWTIPVRTQAGLVAAR